MGKAKDATMNSDTRAQFAEAKVLEVLEKAATRMEAIAERVEAT